MPAANVSSRPAKSKAAPAAAEAVETVERASESLNQVSAEYMSLYAEGLSAIIASGGDTSRLLNDVRKSYSDAAVAAAGRFAALAREALSCRTLSDALGLQQQVLESVNASVAETSQIYGNLFEAWSKTVDPLVARAADGPQRMFRAFAD